MGGVNRWLHHELDAHLSLSYFSFLMCDSCFSLFLFHFHLDPIQVECCSVFLSLGKYIAGHYLIYRDNADAERKFQEVQKAHEVRLHLGEHLIFVQRGCSF